MESRRTDSPACSDAAVSSRTARSCAVPVYASKITCLRRYVTGSAARLLVAKEASSVSHQLHGGEQTSRRKRRVGSRVDISGIGHEWETRSRNVSGFRLVHDALGEAEAPLPRVSVQRCSASGLPSSSSSRRAAASFDALQFGRVRKPRAGWKAEAYSLAAEENTLFDPRQPPSDSELNVGFSVEEVMFCDSADSDDEAVVVVDDMGQNVCFDYEQQRQVKTLLKADEQQLQSKQCIGQGPAQIETATSNRVFPAWGRSPLPPTHPGSTATNANSREVPSPEGATHFISKARNATNILEGLNLSTSRTTHADTETAKVADASGEERKCGGQSGGIERDSDAEPMFRSKGERDSQRGVSRPRRGDDHMWTAEDGDLSPPRRNSDQRLNHGKAEGGECNRVSGRSTSSFAVEGRTVHSSFTDRGDCGAGAKTRLPVHSGTDISRRGQRAQIVDVLENRRGERPPAMPVNRSSAEGDRIATGTADAPAKLPGVCDESAAKLLEVRRCLTRNAPPSRACEANSSCPEGEAALIGKRAHTIARDDAWRTHLTEGGANLERTSRGSGESPGSPAGGAALGNTKSCSEGNLPLKNVVYRDRHGRIITEEEWLECKDPLSRRRRHERVDKERLPPVQLAWGGGLVQQVERTQTTAEEALLGQQPLARYELDEDFDLALQRKQRWDDPVAKVPIWGRAAQEDAEVAFTVKVDAHPKELGEGAPKRIADKPRCPFDAPKNRFGIQPGYRWDGVVRGNGYEDRRLEALNKRRLEERLKHTNNVADM